MRILSTFLLFSLLLNSSIAQHYDFNQRCKNAYTSITSLDFNTGRALISREVNENPSNLIPVYLENYIDFLTLIIGEREEDLVNFESNKSKRLTILEKGDKSSPYYNYCLGNVNLQWAFARLKLKEYFTAFFEINRAFSRLKKNQEDFPDFLPNKIGLGLLHIMFGTIPDNYKWAANIMGLRGEVNQGIMEIESVLEKATEDTSYAFLIPESVFYLTSVQLILLKNDDQLLKSGAILHDLPNENPLIVFAKANYFMKTGRNDKAIEVLNARKHQSKLFPFLYLEYMTGVAKLNSMDDEALSHLKTYVNHFDGINYLASAYQKIAWLHLIQGDTSGYYENINLSLSAPESVVGADEAARMEAKRNQVPNVKLLKSRLLFDGGYYEEGLELLLSLSLNLFNDKDDLTEYYYRLGRTFQETGELDRSVTNFNNAIQYGRESDRYFAGNAALQCGIIFERQGEIAEAIKFYNLCLDLDFEEYEQSIKHKARGRLNAIK